MNRIKWTFDDFESRWIGETDIGMTFMICQNDAGEIEATIDGESEFCMVSEQEESLKQQCEYQYDIRVAKIAEANGYTKRDPLKVEISEFAARKLTCTVKRDHYSDGPMAVWDDAAIKRAYDEVTEARQGLCDRVATALEIE